MKGARVSEPALRPDWLKREIAVIGLARSGRAVATLLARTGNSVYGSDAGSSSALEETSRALANEGVDVDLGKHDVDRVLRASLVVVSPGVPNDAPVLVAAHERGVDVVSEMEIALRFLPDLNYIAITGTNGKTTTTALVAHLLQVLEFRAVAAGNIGHALSEVALDPALPHWVALEVSSYQLHFTPSIRPRVGVFTNMSPNHLDRYGSVDAYCADKKLLFKNADPRSIWVTNADDVSVRTLSAEAAGVHARFSAKGRADAWYDRDSGQLSVLGARLIQRPELALLGDHNVANALAASLSVMLASPEHRTPEAVAKIADGLRSFRPLEHRIEVVRDSGDILWINDSKSTNVTSTLVAVQGMTRPTVLLLGGKHKGEPYTSLAPALRRTVKRVIAYGEAATLIARDLEGVVPVELVERGTNFSDVIERARRAAAPGDAILLSPACSSFDMFDNYEKRGTEFGRLANAS